jgi:hypothetical protein
MRITDDRYTGELEKFDLAVRMIGHEARTGTIRMCTGFTEDRIRKLYGTYFRSADGAQVRRRRGKSPRQIGRFVSSAGRQTEATLLACLFLFCKALRLNARGEVSCTHGTDKTTLGLRLCQAFETYLELHPQPQLSFEWAWNLYHALVESRELYFSWCDSCDGAYIQDTFALDYARCPLCEIKDQELTGQPDG